MTEAEKNEIVGLVMTQISSQAVDFDIATEEPKANDLLTAVRENESGGYKGVTIKWDDVARIATELANQAATRAEQAKTNVENMKSSVEQTVTDFNALAEEKKQEVQGVYQSDLNELKGDLANITGTRKASFTSGYNITLAGYSVGDVIDLTPSAIPSYSYSIENCSYGEFVILNCEGGGNPRAWAFLDSDNKLISVSKEYLVCSNLKLDVPYGASKIVINSITSRLGNCYFNFIVNRIEKLETTVSFLKQSETIYIRGLGTKISGDSGVTGVGQYYAHSIDRKLKLITSYTSTTDFIDTTLNFSDAHLYVYEGKLYKYSGSNDFDGLIKIEEDEHVRKQTLDSYVYQMMNILDYIGESNFYGRKLTIAEANAYVSWPMISYTGDEIVCCYARGNSHTDGYSGTYYKTSPNGIIWSSEKALIDTSLSRENVTGKGFDINGCALFWVRIGNNFNLYKYDGSEFTVVASGITVGSFAHFGDIIKVDNDELICFWNNYATNRSYGIARSTDNGETWTITTFTAESSNSEVPTETQGVYLGDGRILAIGRKDISGGTYAQMQFQSSDNGETWTKEYTNITDIGGSTTSMIYDSLTNEVYAYYYNRGNGKLLMRYAQISDVWDNPTNWPASEIIITGGTGQDAGNVNVVPKNGKHYISYYSGNSVNTGVFCVIKNLSDYS